MTKKNAYIIAENKYDYVILFPDDDVLRIDIKRLEVIQEKWNIVDISEQVNNLIKEKAKKDNVILK